MVINFHYADERNILEEAVSLWVIWILVCLLFLDSYIREKKKHAAKIMA